MLAEGIDEAFQVQAMGCRTLGSALYADLFETYLAPEEQPT